MSLDHQSLYSDKCNYVAIFSFVGMLVGAPIFMLWDFKKWRRRSMAQKNMQGYLEDPVTFMIKRASMVIERVADLDNVMDYVNLQMEPARAYLDAMRSAVPKLVDSNRKLMEDILNDKRTRKEIEERYLRYETIIPKLQEKLADYGNTYIREYDFTGQQLEIIPYETNVFGKQNKTLGIWTEVKHGKIWHDGKSLAISIKTYRKKTSSIHLLMEEINWRWVQLSTLL